MSFSIKLLFEIKSIWDGFGDWLMSFLNQNVRSVGNVLTHDEKREILENEKV
jgi:hypothetical protein